MEFEFPVGYRRFGPNSYGIIVPAIEDCFIEDAPSLEDGVKEAKSTILAFLTRMMSHNGLSQLEVEPIDTLADNMDYFDFMWMTIKVSQDELASLPLPYRVELPQKLIQQIQQKSQELNLPESEFMAKVLQDFFRIDFVKSLDLNYSARSSPVL